MITEIDKNNTVSVDDIKEGELYYSTYPIEIISKPNKTVRLLMNSLEPFMILDIVNFVKTTQLYSSSYIAKMRDIVVINILYKNIVGEIWFDTISRPVFEFNYINNLLVGNLY